MKTRADIHSEFNDAAGPSLTLTCWSLCEVSMCLARREREGGGGLECMSVRIFLTDLLLSPVAHREKKLWMCRVFMPALFLVTSPGCLAALISTLKACSSILHTSNRECFQSVLGFQCQSASFQDGEKGEEIQEAKVNLAAAKETCLCCNSGSFRGTWWHFYIKGSPNHLPSFASLSRMLLMGSFPDGCEYLENVPSCVPGYFFFLKKIEIIQPTSVGSWSFPWLLTKMME